MTGALAPAEPGAHHKIKRFWVDDKHFYYSPWYAAKHRKMINFGCTAAPYYDPSPLCPRNEGFHHGLDVAMKCGTRLYAGLRGTVVRPNSPGSLGSAYGPYAFRLRNSRLHKDFVIGHVLQVYVEPGDHVAKGDLLARASDQGAPDGCHLHFEVRPAAGLLRVGGQAEQLSQAQPPSAELSAVRECFRPLVSESMVPSIW